MACAGALVALCVSGWTWLRQSSLVEVRHVSVTGVSGSESSAIRASLAGAARDMTTLQVREDRLRTAVAGFPGVRDLRTRADFPHRLHIRVISRTPVGAVAVDGRRLAAAADGMLLEGEPVAGLPLVSLRAGDVAGGRVRERGALRLLALLAVVPASLRSRVTRAFVEGRGLAAAVRDGPTLVFGGPGRPRAKWAAALRLLSEDAASSASHLDLRLPERPVAVGLAPAPDAPGAAATERSISG